MLLLLLTGAVPEMQIDLWTSISVEDYPVLLDSYQIGIFICAFLKKIFI